MSNSAPSLSCVSWDLTTAARPQLCEAPLFMDERHHHDLLTKSYQKALTALESASAVVAGIASGLHDLESSQSDVSARLSVRANRFTGKKRKLSPSVYDYTESCFGAASSKADTPTQELLPASRSELRNHQLHAVRWLASLERQGAGGVLADELEQDRTAEIAGLMSHLASSLPEPQPVNLPPYPAAAAAHQHNQYLQRPHNHSGAGMVQAPGTAGASSSGGGGTGGANVCLLLAPGSRLATWAEAIREHVDVQVHIYDGSAPSAAALQAACLAVNGCGAGGGAAATGQVVLTPRTAAAAAAAAPGPAGQWGRRMANGGACPPLSSTGGCSAAGVFPPRSATGHLHPHGLPHQQHPLSALHPSGPAAAAGARPVTSSSGTVTARLLVVLSPLEQLQRDVPTLTQIPQRMLVVDLASASSSSCGDGGDGSDSGDSSGDRGFGCFRGFRFGSDPGSGGSGPGSGDRGAQQPQRQRGLGLVLEGHPQLHLLTRMPAASRVLLSAGVPEAVGDGIWLLLQLLAPNVQRPLWQTITELQHSLLGAGAVGAQFKESVMSDVQARLWALLRPLVLHRRAHDVDLTTMRTVATNLNLYDHFSAARAEGA